MRHCQILIAAFALLAFQSSHGQIDWRVRASGTAKDISSIAFVNGVFIATDGRPLRSTDGIVWTRPEWPDGEVSNVFAGGGEFLAVGSNEKTGAGYIWRSEDGEVATRTETPDAWDGFRLRSASRTMSAAYANGLWVVCSNGFKPLIVNSSSEIETPTELLWTSPPSWVVSYNEGFIANSDSALFESTDAKIWSLKTRTPYSFGRPLVLGEVFHFPEAISTDGGKTWEERPYSQIWYLNQAVFIKGLFVACGGGIYPENTFIRTSSDGKTWTQRESGSTSRLNTLAYGNGIFVAVGEGGRVTTSGAVDPAQEVIIPQLTVSPSITLKWPSVAGLYYQPEFSEDMQTWAPFGGSIPGSGAEITRSFEVTGQRRYFRVTVR